MPAALAKAPAAKDRQPLRALARLAHRWIGLATASFLLVVGLSGSLLAFNDELELWLAPQLFAAAPPAPGAPMLSPFVLRQRVLDAFPNARVDWVELNLRPGRAVAFRVEGASGAADDAAPEVFINPYTGQIQGTRRPGDLRQGFKSAMPFVYDLHMNLVAGELGSSVLGWVALAWTLDCFVGAYLTFPLRKRAPAVPPAPLAAARDWGRRWAKAWTVRMTPQPLKLIFDWHLASGLWTWLLLGVLAWSSVGFNLRPVYGYVMRHTLGYQIDAPLERPHADPDRAPRLSWPQAREAAARALAAQASAHGFGVIRERAIAYHPHERLYEYRTLGTLDVGSKSGNTTVFIDADSGAFVRLSLPRGQSVGNDVDAWIGAIHTATWGGRAMQVVICLTGLVVAALSVSGVWLWWRRRQGRRARGGRAKPASALRAAAPR